jgi:hypothetical protein
VTISSIWRRRLGVIHLLDGLAQSGDLVGEAGELRIEGFIRGLVGRL